MIVEFEWEESNKHKSLLKHGITNQEAETTFDDPQKIILFDEKHSDMEDRYICIGKSDLGNILYTAFTFRNGKVRIISTRPANKKNIANYETEQ